MPLDSIVLIGTFSRAYKAIPHASTFECPDTLLDLPTVAPDIRAEYLRWVGIVGEADPYAGPDTLGIHDVLKAHFLLADFFFAAGEGLGGLGPRDCQLLHSALYRQHIAFEGKQKWETQYQIAANLLYGLIKDHPFHDANKRTAFLSTLYYLFTKGCVPTVSQKHYEDFTVEIADDKLGKMPDMSLSRKRMITTQKLASSRIS